MIFFAHDPYRGASRVDDMRMNGTCAGGTGAFIDEIASVLGVQTEQFEDLASRGTTVYEISGRCGVFAKTDIQPLLNQGVAKEDIALSTFHALVKQTVGGLAQGLDINAPVVFQGGPLTFNRTLVRVFSERLGLDPDEVIIPEHPETIVARGAALWLPGSQDEAARAPRDLEDVARALDGMAERPQRRRSAAPAFFSSTEERLSFERRHELRRISPPELHPGDRLTVHLGIDAGSTTTKLVLLDGEGTPIDSFYSSNQGEPVDVARDALVALHDAYEKRGVELEVASIGTTGYGEQLFARAFGADYHTVETVAHARAALAYEPDASFILDIGGQDMKAMWVDRGVITDVIVNEACSSGCGSFLENFARSLGIPVEDIAATAFSSAEPAALGSRCTVFMTSSVISEQRDGKTPADIMAGLCRSIIENVFTKVVRVPNMDALGEHIVVQGGTFANDAVLRAFEQYVGRDVTRSPYPGLMGAIGAALLAKEHVERAAQAAGGDVGGTQTSARKPTASDSSGRTYRRTHDAPSEPAGKKTREQKRAEAEARAELNRRLKKTRDRLKKVERELETKRGRYDELMELMASEELYADQAKFSEALAEYNGLKKDIPALEDEWLELSTTIEEETARGSA